MSRDVFLEILRNKLGNIRPDVLDEIISDFEEHFLVASAGGSTEAEICEELGNPEEIAKQYLEELDPELTNRPVPQKSPEPPNPPAFGQAHSGFEQEDSGQRDSGRGSRQHDNSFDFEANFRDFGKSFEGLGETISKSVELGLKSLQNVFNEKTIDRFNRKIVKAFGVRFNDDFDDDFDNGDSQYGYNSAKQEFIQTDVKAIEINCKKADVRILQSDGDKIVVDFIDDDCCYEVTNEDGTIYITDNLFSQKRGFGRGGFDDCHLFLPKGWNGRVYVKTISGDISISGISGTSEIRLVAVSGDIHIDSCDAPVIPHTASGDIHARELNVALANSNHQQSYRISSGSGDIYIENFSCDVPSEISGGSGDMRLTESKCLASVKTGSGDITLEDVEGDIYASTGSGDIKMREHNGNISCSTGSGDIEVSTRAITEASKYSTGSGTIKLDVYETSAPISLSSSVGTIFVKIKEPGADMMAKTSTGNVKLKFGNDVNFKLLAESKVINNKFTDEDMNKQRKQINIMAKARHGSVSVDKIER